MIIYEIAIKNTLEIDKYVEQIIKNNISNISITNKYKNLDNLFIAKRFAIILGKKVDITVIYSIRIHGVKSKNYSIQMWDDFLRQCIHQNQKKILVVSGSPKSIQFTSVEALQYASKYRDYGLEFGVAFNPFLDDPSEYERLVQKVSSGIVSRIYFQLGDNYLLLKKGLKFCNQNFPNITKFVSILTPSERLLNSLNFRQWNGVNFSKSFLSDSKRASDINEQLIRIAAKNSAEIYLTGFLEQYTR